MTTLTAALLVGKPGYGDEFDVNNAISVWNKVTTASSAIGIGKVAVLNESTGVGAKATAGSTGLMGIVPALAPVNVDSDSTFMVVNRIGSEIYTLAGTGTIKPNSRLKPDSNGDLVPFTASDVTATPTESTIEAAILDYLRAPFVYVGHYGEGRGLSKPATENTVSGTAIRVRHL